MQIHYDVERIRRIMRDVTCLTGISMAFMNTRMEYICNCRREDTFCSAIHKDPITEERCRHADSRILADCEQSLRPESHICHAGLFDVSIPIVKNSLVVGYLVSGQVRLPDSALPEVFRGDPRLVDLWNQHPCYSVEQLESFMNLLPRFLLAEAIQVRHDDLASDVADYMKQNLAQKLDIDQLCNTFFVSKNTLYRLFEKTYGTTVKQYLISLRMDEARRLLTHTDLPISEVAAAVGIGDYHYFCRAFTRETGISPGAFRKQQQQSCHSPAE